MTFAAERIRLRCSSVKTAAAPTEATSCAAVLSGYSSESTFAIRWKIICCWDVKTAPPPVEPSSAARALHTVCKGIPPVSFSKTSRNILLTSSV